MTSRAVNRQLANYSDRLYRLAGQIPETITHLDQQRTYITPLQASVTDRGRTSRGGYNDPTLATTQRLEHIEYRRGCLYDALGTIGIAIDLLEQADRDARQIRIADTIDPLTNPVDDPDRPLCRGGQPDTWGDPSCGQHVEHFHRVDGSLGFRAEGLCARHRKRKERYERGLPVEDDAA